MQPLSPPRNNGSVRPVTDGSANSRHPELERIPDSLSDRDRNRKRAEELTARKSVPSPIVGKLAKRVRRKPRHTAIASAMATFLLCSVAVYTIVQRPHWVWINEDVESDSPTPSSIGTTTIDAEASSSSVQQEILTGESSGVHIVLPVAPKSLGRHARLPSGTYDEKARRVSSTASHSGDPSDDDLIVHAPEASELVSSSPDEADDTAVDSEPIRSLLTSITARLGSIAVTFADASESMLRPQELAGYPADDTEEVDIATLGTDRPATLALADPPRYEADELKRAVELARQATTDLKTDAWKSEERSEQRRLAREFYIRLSEMSLRALFVDAAEPAAKVHQQMAHELLLELVADEDKFQFIGNAAKGWLQWPQRDSNGIVLAGHVTHARIESDRCEFQIQLTDSHQTAVTLVTSISSLGDQPLQEGDRVLAMGILIDDAAQQMKNYNGSHSSLIWGRPIFGTRAGGPGRRHEQLKVDLTQL